MAKFNVTVEFSGTKTYEVEARNADHVYALFHEWSSFDSYNNPIDDSVSEVIVGIKKLESEALNSDTLFLVLRNLYADYAEYCPSSVNNSFAMEAAREILENGR
jgi:hypothetical protein